MGCIQASPGLEPSQSKKVKAKEPSGKKVKQYIDNSFIINIATDYKYEKQLGSGNFGTVWQARYLHGDDQKFAIKSIKKGSIKDDMSALEQLQREIGILKNLDHPNIVKLHEVYEDAKYVNIIMEQCQGGELFDRIMERGRYDEVEAASIIRQVLLSVNILHENGIAHRDLKPENFMFVSDDEKANLKLIDFGLSRKFTDDKNERLKMQSIVGSAYYTAPEVLQGLYGPECDVWSAGVILFILLSGVFPFASTVQTEVFYKILHVDVKLNKGKWKYISDEAKSLVREMLTKDPSQRITAAEALEHRWFSNDNNDAIALKPDILKSLRDYRARSIMQQQAMNVLVKYLDVEELKELSEIFKQMDINNTGSINFEELQNALNEAGIQTAKEEIEQIIQKIDIHRNGVINYSEFLAATISSQLALTEQRLWFIFKKYDVDNTGTISPDNIKQASRKAGKSLRDSQIKEMIAQVDMKNNGVIDFEEFQQLMLPESAGNRFSSIASRGSGDLFKSNMGSEDRKIDLLANSK